MHKHLNMLKHLNNFVFYGMQMIIFVCWKSLWILKTEAVILREFSIENRQPERIELMSLVELHPINIRQLADKFYVQCNAIWLECHLPHSSAFCWVVGFTYGWNRTFYVKSILYILDEVHSTSSTRWRGKTFARCKTSTANPTSDGRAAASSSNALFHVNFAVFEFLIVWCGFVVHRTQPCMPTQQ